MNGPETTPSETARDPIGLIVERFITRLAGVVRDGRAFRSRLRDAGPIEHGAIALEVAAAAEHVAAACAETTRLLRAYARHEPVTERDLRASPRARCWSWRTAAKVITALAALLAAFAAWKGAHR